MQGSYKLYSTICWVFCAAFAAVLIGLALLPDQLVALMNWSTGLFGLGGEIGMGAGDLDHVLSLSLMSCIVVLAAYSAKRPQVEELFVALLTAKVVSTAGFAYLALIGGGVWILPTLTDGLVIVGLVVARRLGASEGTDREPEAAGAKSTA